MNIKIPFTGHHIMILVRTKGEQTIANRNRQRRHVAKCKVQKLCPVDQAPLTTINRHTKKLYKKCDPCRERENYQAKMRRRTMTQDHGESYHRAKRRE